MSGGPIGVAGSGAHQAKEHPVDHVGGDAVKFGYLLIGELVERPTYATHRLVAGEVQGLVPLGLPQPSKGELKQWQRPSGGITHDLLHQTLLKPNAPVRRGAAYRVAGMILCQRRERVQPLIEPGCAPRDREKRGQEIDAHRVDQPARVVGDLGPREEEVKQFRLRLAAGQQLLELVHHDQERSTRAVQEPGC